MIIDISHELFRRIMNDDKLFLPFRWDGIDFKNTLKEKLDYYLSLLKYVRDNPQIDNSSKLLSFDLDKVESVTQFLIESVNHYLSGFPHSAFDAFTKAMRIFEANPLKVYNKSVLEHFKHHRYNDPLSLYRVVKVDDNKPYPRSRVFHTPYNLRSKVSTSRYSIAGFPSLYLGTSLELCCEEINFKNNNSLALASLFKIDRSINDSNTYIKVIELGIKPQDFLGTSIEDNRDKERYRSIKNQLPHNSGIKSSYLLWYPLIAACSFIRCNKNDPFAPEYIIPQLLMQWVRYEASLYPNRNKGRDRLIGIRYFSCASVKASEMGFNYVFPTSGKQLSDTFPFCSVLSKAFYISNPVFLHEYDNVNRCENVLFHLGYSDKLKKVDFIPGSNEERQGSD